MFCVSCEFLRKRLLEFGDFRDAFTGLTWIKPGREGPVSVMDFGENPWDDFNYRPIVDIVANKKSVYRWF